MKKSRILAAVFVVLLVTGLVFAAGSVSCGKPDSNFSPAEYDKKFSTRYSRAFPVLARDILRQAQVNRGICVDIGCGPGYLGIAIAKNSAMTVHSLDILPEMIELVKKRVAEVKLEHRVHPVVGDVHAMPYADGFADLAVSRGSLPFWKDKRKAFGEIYRILKPGGEGHIGCGFGAGYAVLEKRKDSRSAKPQKKFTHDEILAALENAGIEDFTVIDDNLRGYWVIIRKK